MTYYPPSSVPGAIDYIVAATQQQISTDPNSKSIVLTLAELTEIEELPPETISIGEVRRATEPKTFQGGGGQYWLNETYTIDCNVWAWTGSSDTDGALTIQLQQVHRVWQLYSYIETGIRLDPSLGDLVNIAYPKTTTQPTISWSGNPVGIGLLLNFEIFVSNLN